MAKIKLPLIDGMIIARRLRALLAPACERIEIAGSLRRLKPEVGDIELVCIPRRAPNLLGEPGESILSGLLVSLLREGVLLPAHKNGEKYKQFYWGELPALQIDLFITTPEEWGLRFTLSTGPKEFNQRLVLSRQRGGLLPSCYEIRGNRVWFKNTPLPTSEERDLFALIGGWVPPEERA